MDSVEGAASQNVPEPADAAEAASAEAAQTAGEAGAAQEAGQEGTAAQQEPEAPVTGGSLLEAIHGAIEAWQAHASDPGAAALQSKLEHSLKEVGDGRLREEARLEISSKRDGATDKLTLEYKEGPKIDRSKWDKPTTKLEGGKLKSTRETKYTDKEEASFQYEGTRQFKEPADPELLKKLEERGRQLEKAQKGLDFLADKLGLKKEVSGKREAKAEAALIKFKEVSEDGKSEISGFMGARSSAVAEGKASLGLDGLKAEGKAEAKAGLYEEISGKKKGDWGSVEGSMGAKAEVRAGASGSAKLDVTGLEVKAKAEAGAEISASVSGKYTTPPVKIGGQDLTASIAANGRAALEARAGAEGKVAFTWYPPKAIVEGKAGASAVAKLDGDVKVSAGPFAVKASGYVSAGAEAQASASIGYDDGKLRFSFGAGAALGVGAGGKVEMEVDLKQIKEVAVGVAEKALDVDGDGKLSLGDARAGVEKAAKAVDRAVDTAVDAAKDTVKSAVSWVGSLF